MEKIEIPEVSSRGSPKQTNSFVCDSADNYVIEKLSSITGVSLSRIKRFLIRQGLIALLGNAKYFELLAGFTPSLEAVIAEEKNV